MLQLFFLYRKNPQHALSKRVGISQNLSGCCGEDKILAHVESQTVFPWLPSPYPNQHTDYAILAACCTRKDTGICMHCVIVTGTNTVQRNNGCVVWLCLKKTLKCHTLSGNKKYLGTT